MKSRTLAVLALTLGLLHPVAAKAITYTAFSNTSGIVCQTGCVAEATMEGFFTIEDIGTISSPAQILDYSLTLDNRNVAHPFKFFATLTPANSTFDIRGDFALTATGTELFMSFGSGGRFIIDGDVPNAIGVQWLFRSITGGPPVHRIGGVSEFRYAPGANVLIGIASPPTSIPLPASISLFLTGLGALGASALAKRVRRIA